MTHLQPAPENDWHPKAACRGHDPDLWFGWDSESINARKAREQAAKRTGAPCPRPTQGLPPTLPSPKPYEIWEGLTDPDLVADRCRRGLNPHPAATTTGSSPAPAATTPNPT